MPPIDDLSRPHKLTPPPLPRASIDNAAAAGRSCSCVWQFLAGVAVGLGLALAGVGILGGACRPDPAPAGDDGGVPVDEPHEPAPPGPATLHAMDPGEQSAPQLAVPAPVVAPVAEVVK